MCDSPDEIRRRMTKTSDGGKWFGTRWAVMCGPIAGCFIAFNIDAAGPTRRARFGCQQNGCRVAAGTTLKASSPPLPLPIWRPPKRRCSVLVIARSSQRPIDADDKKKLVAFLAKPHAAAFHPVWRFFFRSSGLRGQSLVDYDVIIMEGPINDYDLFFIEIVTLENSRFHSILDL